MLAWSTRWKIGIYQSIQRAKILSKKLTVPLWKIWEPDRTDEPKKKVDRRRVAQLKPKKYKATKITNKLKVKGRVKSTSRAPAVVVEKKYRQVKFDDLKTIVLEKNDALYGDAFND